MLPRESQPLNKSRWIAGAAALLAFTVPASAQRQPAIVAPPPPVASFADLAKLTESADIVAVVEVRDQALVEPARAPGLAPGKARLYLEVRTQALLFGRSGVGQDLVYLADVPLLPNGKPPKLKKQRFLIYADPASGQPGALQLVEPDAQLPANPQSEEQARRVIAALASSKVPNIEGIREVMSVPGNLVGESETQVFLDTDTGDPVSLSIVRRPGMEPQWGVSWTEIVDQAARPPEPETVAWYRLACFLPRQIPSDAFLQDDRRARGQADADYQVILEQLGPCERLRV